MRKEECNVHLSESEKFLQSRMAEEIKKDERFRGMKNGKFLLMPILPDYDQYSSMVYEDAADERKYDGLVRKTEEYISSVSNDTYPMYFDLFITRVFEKDTDGKFTDEIEEYNEELYDWLISNVKIIFDHDTTREWLQYQGIVHGKKDEFEFVQTSAAL